MQLTNPYLKDLCAAIEEYDYPRETYDFKENKEVYHPNMRTLEAWMLERLRGQDRCTVKDGLSNVLYWGYSRGKGLREYRIKRFRNSITYDKLDSFMKIVPDTVGIRRIQMPQFSGMSFITKIMMFLDPGRYPVLDMKIANAFSQKPEFGPLEHLVFRKKTDTSIRITKNNRCVYNKWAAWCEEIATWANAQLLCPSILAADVERAVFVWTKESEQDRGMRLLRGPDG